jgi:hypothetical protein
MSAIANGQPRAAAVPPAGPEEVRAACARIARDARAVHIDTDALTRAARRLAGEQPNAPRYDTAVHYRGTVSETACYVLCLDAINFGSGYFASLRKRPGLSGYGTVALGLAERFAHEGTWSAEQLTGLEGEDLRRLFAQDPADPDVEALMALFADSLHALGLWLSDAYGGSFVRLVENAAGCAVELVRSLSVCPAFADRPHYRGRPVPLLKRAQIAAWDLYLAFGAQPPAAFADIDRLTAFADNVLPHALRLDGVLHYSTGLAGRIDAGEPLPAGSEEEVELRACAVHAVELLVERIRWMKHTAYPALIDYVLWNRPRSDRFRSLPRHRTRTTAY